MSNQLRTTVLILAVVVSACSSATLESADQSERGVVATTTAEAVDDGVRCEGPPTEVPWTAEESAQTVLLAEGSDTSPRVEAVRYPHPDYEGKPWSHWGQGVVLDDGRYLSGVGDHRAPDGNAYLFEYNPASRLLTRIGDVQAIAGHAPGDWGYGKIHAQMVRGPCDNVMVTTYWGSRRGIEFTAGYQGDVLISIDPQRLTIGAQGVFYPEHGVPSLAASPDGTLLYAEAVDPLGDDAGAFVVREAADGSTVFVDSDPSHTGYRSIAVDAEGRAYYSIGGGRLAVYDPQSNTQSVLDAELPGNWLRAATGPDADGTVYGVTREPEVFFALSPEGMVRSLGAAVGYTTSVALSPDGTKLYSVPRAHGDSWKHGAPLIAVDTTTGMQEIVVELQPLAAQHLGMRLGGTYSVAIDSQARTIYLGMNASDTNDDGGFGEVVLIIVTLP